MKNTYESLEITRKISDSIEGGTFHHHYYILLDIVNSYPEDYSVNYVEIGCYAGGSSCLVSQRKNTNLFSIDLGHPISKEIPINNVKKFNTNNNLFQYIQGDSKKITTFNELKKYLNEIDVLFIDGDHSFNGVKSDFELYSPLVKTGGYIIFDDYNDKQHSPAVKPAVDEIVSIITEYEIIGTIPNTYGARPKELLDGNCFIIKKI